MVATTQLWWYPWPRPGYPRVLAAAIRHSEMVIAVDERQTAEVDGRIAATVRAVERSWRDLDRNEWNERILSAGGSFLGCWVVLRVHRWIASFRFFEFQLHRADGSPSITIGQCALFRKGG